ncbi:hypothetical protein BKA70DRAFT_1424113 [Coprinopsis sp. MPI-PUGE-AT-0042]|nr:hypothetical protein BKA70DRAFT_1424113 [Coprinopsis sp. MPI-PUGE-AT-0042]
MIELLLEPLANLGQRVVDFSKLRILEFPPEEVQAHPCVSKILDQAQKTLEELNATRVKSPLQEFTYPTYTPITSYTDLQILQQLHTICLDVPISFEDDKRQRIISDISEAFNAVPLSSGLCCIVLSFLITGYHPFEHARSQDWHQLARDIAHHAVGRRVEAIINLCVTGKYLIMDCDKDEGRRELCELIESQMDTVWKEERGVASRFRINV